MCFVDYKFCSKWSDMGWLDWARTTHDVPNKRRKNFDFNF
jgi:hypothetical protein